MTLTYIPGGNTGGGGGGGGGAISDVLWAENNSAFDLNLGRIAIAWEDAEGLEVTNPSFITGLDLTSVYKVGFELDLEGIAGPFAWGLNCGRRGNWQASGYTVPGQSNIMDSLVISCPVDIQPDGLTLSLDVFPAPDVTATPVCSVVYSYVEFYKIG